MEFPDRIDARWLSTLTDQELQQAEWELRGSFARQESAEKRRRGVRYDLMAGPLALTDAWMRWTMASNAAHERGVRLRYRR